MRIVLSYIFVGGIVILPDQVIPTKISRNNKRSFGYRCGNSVYWFVARDCKAYLTVVEMKGACINYWFVALLKEQKVNGMLK